MSWKALSWAEDQMAGSAGAKLVLFVLAGYADKKGFSYPSQKSISEISEQGVRTVRRHLAHMEELGLLTREVRQRETGGRTSDGYQLNLPLAPGQNGHARPASMARALGQKGGDPPAKMARVIEPAIEPVIEPVQQDVLERMHQVVRDVTGHPTWKLSDNRRRRYRAMRKEHSKGHTESEFLTLWTIMYRAIWSQPWRQRQTTGHDPFNILRSPEQRESWWDVAELEHQCGRDGRDHYESTQGEPAKESATDNRKRRVAVEHQAVEKAARERAEDLKADKVVESATLWYGRLSTDEQAWVEKEVATRLAMQFPGVPVTKGLKKAVFLKLYEEREAA